MFFNNDADGVAAIALLDEYVGQLSRTTHQRLCVGMAGLCAALPAEGAEGVILGTRSGVLPECRAIIAAEYFYDFKTRQPGAPKTIKSREVKSFLFDINTNKFNDHFPFALVSVVTQTRSLVSFNFLINSN